MRVCVTCSHAEREIIEQSIMTGASIAELSRRYGISEDSLFHHKANCIPKRLAEAQADADLFSTNTIMQRLEYIQRETMLMYAASKGTDNALALKCLARAETQLNTAIRVREFLNKKDVATGGVDIAEILAGARRRLAGHNPPREEPATEAAGEA